MSELTRLVLKLTVFPAVGLTISVIILTATGVV